MGRKKASKKFQRIDDQGENLGARSSSVRSERPIQRTWDRVWAILASRMGQVMLIFSLVASKWVGKRVSTSVGGNMENLDLGAPI